MRSWIELSQFLRIFLHSFMCGMSRTWATDNVLQFTIIAYDSSGSWEHGVWQCFSKISFLSLLLFQKIIRSPL